jgi:hypothetical protein
VCLGNGELFIISLSCNALWGMYRIYKKTTATSENVGGVVWMLVSTLALCGFPQVLILGRGNLRWVGGVKTVSNKKASLPKR